MTKQLDHTATVPPKLKFVSIRDWTKLYGYPSYGALKGMILKRRQNGFEKCLMKINGRIYIDVAQAEKFFGDLVGKV